MRGSVTKRCTCAPTYSATGNRLACKKDHGSWAYVVDLGRDPHTKRRRQEKRGGFRTRDEAEQAMAVVIKAIDEALTPMTASSPPGSSSRNGLRTRLLAGCEPPPSGPTASTCATT
jgi:hypothetical protein